MRAHAERIAWVDTARGIAILLVVLYHATLFTASLESPLGWWAPLARALRTLRMPLFFLASGMLAATSLDRPWRVLWRTKFVVWLWLYALWSVLLFAFFAVVPWPRPAPSPSGSAWDLVTIVVWPINDLWYLYALAVFLLVLRALRPCPPTALLGMTGALAVLSGSDLVSTGNFAIDSMCRFAFFFVLGAVARPWLQARTEHVTTGTVAWLALSTLVFTIVVLVLADVLDWPLRSAGDAPFVLFGSSLLITGTGVAVSVLVTGSRPARLLARLGRQTLPIYVAHTLVLGALTWLLRTAIDRPPATLGMLLPPLMTVAAIVLALVLHRVAADVPGLYAPPRWLARPPGSSRRRLPPPAR